MMRSPVSLTSSKSDDDPGGLAYPGEPLQGGHGPPRVRRLETAVTCWPGGSLPASYVGHVAGNCTSSGSC